MCGIFGIVTKKEQDCSSPLLAALARLEYRGYDSAGIAVLGEHALKLKKKAGRIAVLQKRVPVPLIGTAGIGHTRWATHGPPNDKNAHPHTDCSGRIAIVHNGIIENEAELRRKLVKRGHTFRSDTDSEVVAHLIEHERSLGNAFEQAVRRALAQVIGAYALAVVDAAEPDRMVVARYSSPLVIGVSDDATYVASDAAALVFHTRNVVYLKDGQVATLSPGTVKISSLGGRAIRTREEVLDFSADATEKSGYAHFMLKEIHEEPDAVRAVMAGRLIKNQGKAKLGGLEEVAHRLFSARRVILTACGTAFYAALTGAYMLRQWGCIDAQAELASELRYAMPHMTEADVLVAVSQSGETADTMAVLSETRKRNLLSCGIVNVVGSSIARATDAGVYTHAGPEIGVASTKAFLAQLTALVLLTLLIGRERGMSPRDGCAIASALSRIPKQMKRILKQRTAIRRVARVLARTENAFYLGRGMSYPVALEGALKLKEVSYIHAEGYGAGEMKHGPIALIDKAMPTVVIVPNDELHAKTIANIQEVKARGGPVIAIATTGDRQVERLADHVLWVPATHDMLTPLLTTVPLHCMAYEVGVLLDRDVDKPRNLAKSVTVE